MSTVTKQPVAKQGTVQMLALKHRPYEMLLS